MSDFGNRIFVSHGDAIRALLAKLSGVEPHVAPWVALPNGAVARVDSKKAIW